MSASADWLQQLEARLEEHLEAFLRANPNQEALLEEQERLDWHTQQRERLQQAQALRSELLDLARSIQQWRGRVERAQQAGEQDLAQRAQQHLDQLMERGRSRWHTLETLGRSVQHSEQQQQARGQRNASDAEPKSRSSASREPLDQAWARFETEQELEALRRRQGG